MKKKGFTLIELLAVIVILAIIALIVTPIVSDIIESSKKAAAKRSVEGYIEAANNAAAVSLIDTAGINVTNEKYSFETGEDNEALAKVDISGKKPNYVYLEYDYQLLRVVLANFCYNGYAFDYDNGIIEDGTIDYCSVAFTNRPKIVVTGEGELNSKVTIAIDYTETTVGKQYKIGSGEYIDYTEPFELESSKELASQRDIHGNLKICAKATIESGESTEICRSINKLDLDYPAEPVIEANIEYPTLYETGISIGSLDITYSQGEDITNYVSFNGTDWSVYTGNETVVGSTIYAKSVKNKSGLATIATKTVATSAVTDALPPEAYNGNTTDAIPSGTYYLKLDDSVKGKDIDVYFVDDSSGHDIKIWYADADKKTISGTTVTLSDCVGDKTSTYTVNSSASYLVVKTTHASWATIREIAPVNYPSVTLHNYDHPVLHADGSVAYDTVHVEITYSGASAQKLYKINDGEWTTYTDQFDASVGNTIYAKSIFASGAESLTTTYNIVTPEGSLPPEAYNGNTTDAIPSGTYYLKLDDSIKGKEIDIYFVDNSSGHAVSFWYADADKKTISGTNVTLADCVGDKTSTYTVNSSASYLVVKTTSPTLATVREIKAANYPKVTLHNHDVPVFYGNGTIAYDTVHVELTYSDVSTQRLYKINDGEWAAYTDQVNASVGSTIYAKSVFANGTESLTTTYKIDSVAGAIPENLYNGDKTDTIPTGTYYLKLDDSVKGKQFKIYFNDSSSGHAVKFWYADADKKTISGTTVTLADRVGDSSSTYTVNSSANYLVIKTEHVNWATVREIELAN